MNSTTRHVYYAILGAVFALGVAVIILGGSMIIGGGSAHASDTPAMMGNVFEGGLGLATGVVGLLLVVLAAVGAAQMRGSQKG